MDSKLKALVSLFAVLSVLTVVGIVLMLNAGSGKKRGGRGQAATDVPKEPLTEDTEYVDHDLVEKYGLNPAYDPYAFLEDASFFLSEDETEEKEEANSLSLLCSSIQKDIRIFVVDGNGAVASGSEFEVTIRKRSGSADESMRTLKDQDRDGILYADGLSSGEYEVMLMPVEGYSVPFDATDVTINDQISYTLLSDISFMIHKESDDVIDAQVEDTAVREAENDADGTETNVLLSDGASILGIDVSKWNRDIDWNRVKAQGVDYTIIRCGYRGSRNGYLIEDPYFEQNIKGALDAGVRVGVYFFTQAKTAAEGVEEASMVLSLIRDYELSFPLYIDTEGAGGGRADNLSVEERTAAVRAFCETVESAGYTAGIYASKSWFTGRLDMEKLSGYSIWLAQYSSRATYDGVYDMWQYTSAGKLDGISTLVDLDLSYVDYTDAKGHSPRRIDDGTGENEENAALEQDAQDAVIPAQNDAAGETPEAAGDGNGAANANAGEDTNVTQVNVGAADAIQ